MHAACLYSQGREYPGTFGLAMQGMGGAEVRGLLRAHLEA